MRGAFVSSYLSIFKSFVGDLTRSCQPVLQTRPSTIYPPSPTTDMARPFRAEHMGSLLRPQDLLAVRETIRDKGVSDEEAGLPAVEKKAVEDVVKLQTELGFKAVTSGEFNRTRFWGLMWDEFEGTIRLQDAEASMFRLYHPDVVSLIEKDRKVMPGDSVIAGSKLSHNTARSVSNLHELKLVQAALPKSEWKNIKLTMITPAWFHMRYKQNRAYTKEAYANDGEYFADVAKVYQAELKMLYDAGLRNVQFDDPGLACEFWILLPSLPCLGSNFDHLLDFCSDKFRQGWAEDKDNIGTVDDLLDAYIALYNDSISKCPADMHTGVHLCRGNVGLAFPFPSIQLTRSSSSAAATSPRVDTTSSPRSSSPTSRSTPFTSSTTPPAPAASSPSSSSPRTSTSSSAPSAPSSASSRTRRRSSSASTRLPSSSLREAARARRKPSSAWPSARSVVSAPTRPDILYLSMMRRRSWVSSGRSPTRSGVRPRGLADGVLVPDCSVLVWGIAVVSMLKGLKRCLGGKSIDFQQGHGEGLYGISGKSTST